MKTKHNLLWPLCAALGLMSASWTASAQNATISTPIFAESTVQYVAGAAPTSFTNYVTGYDKVKWSLTAPAKSYLKFDFTGQNPNTNYFLKFSSASPSQNGQTHYLVWAMNQDYPGFASTSPTLTWSNAQANFTGTNEATFNTMLTNGTFSATLISDFLASGGSSVGVGWSIPAGWGKYLFNNKLVIVLTASNDVANTTGTTANGGRITTNTLQATFQPLTASTLPPSISAFSPISVRSTTASGAIPFTVSDPQDAAASLNNIAVTLGNTNVTLNSLSIVAGSGGNRTLSFTPVSNLAPGVTANVTVTVTVTDTAGNSASSSFLLTVQPFVTLPVLYSGTNVNQIPPTNRVGNGAVAVSFQIGDTNVPAANVVVSAAISPYSLNLGSVSLSQSAFGANTNNCTLTINATNSGVGIVNITSFDTVNSVSNVVSVAVMVLPDSSYAAYDLMAYKPSTSYSSSSGHSDLFNASANLWASRSVSGSVNLITASLPPGVVLIRGTASGNPNQLRLVGAPFTPSSHKVIYACINAQWQDAALYGANAAYPGTSAGGFVEFAADSTASGVAMAAVCTVSNVTNPDAQDGSFYLGLYNGTNSPSVDTGFSQLIPNFNNVGTTPNPATTIVISYDTDSGISRLWTSGSSSLAPSVSLQDVATTNLANVSYLVLRQNAGMGNILINSVTAKTVAKPVPVVTGISRVGNSVTINFTCSSGSGATASVVASGTVDGTYGAISATISEVSSGVFTATFNDASSQRFYRILQTGSAPTVTFPF